MANSEMVEQMFDKPEEELFDMEALEAIHDTGDDEGSLETEQVEEETTEVEATEDVVDTTEEATEEVEEQKTVDIRALHEARAKNKELREMISQKDKEIGKYQYLSTPQTVEAPAVEDSPFNVFDELADDDPMTKGEVLKAFKINEEQLQKKYNAQKQQDGANLAEKQIKEARSRLSEESLGKGLDFETVYGRLESGEYKLSDGQVLDIQKKFDTGANAADLIYQTIVKSDQFFEGAVEAAILKKALAKGKKPSKTSKKKEALNQNDILKIKRSANEHNRSLTDGLQF